MDFSELFLIYYAIHSLVNLLIAYCDRVKCGCLFQGVVLKYWSYLLSAITITLILNINIDPNFLWVTYCHQDSSEKMMERTWYLNTLFILFLQKRMQIFKLKKL